MGFGGKEKEILAGLGMIAMAAASVWIGQGKAAEQTYPLLYLALLWILSGLAALAGADILTGSRISGFAFRERDRRWREREESAESAKKLRLELLDAIDHAVELNGDEELKRLWGLGGSERQDALEDMLGNRNFWPSARFAAAILGETEMIRRLGSLGWDGHGKSATGMTAGRCAAREGNREALRALLDLGWNPNDRNGDGATAGHFAAERGDAGMLALLRSAGWDPLERDEKRGWTALHVAAIRKNTAAVRMLLDMGLHPLDMDYAGQLPSGLAMFSLFGGPQADECVELLRSAERAASERQSLEEMGMAARGDGRKRRGI